MRRPSIADALAGANRAADAVRNAAERVDAALALGRRDILLHAAATNVAPGFARRAVERRRQARRRPSGALRALLE
jgi:hypothetical protein